MTVTSLSAVSPNHAASITPKGLPIRTIVVRRRVMQVKPVS